MASFVLLLTGTVTAQQSPDSAQAVRDLERYRETQIPLWMNDFANLERYREANAKLPSPGPGEQRVVFMGDSITDNWKLAQYFPGKPYVNRGIGGQTTPQMVLRFRHDVIDLQPAAVVILAGTNDIAGNTGPMSLEDIEANYASMVDLAHAHGIKVIFASVTPVNNYGSAAVYFPLRPPQKILDLNRWLKDFSAGNADGYIDYFSAMADDQGMMKQNLADDGLHPNTAGYHVMAPIAEKAIEQAITPK